MAMRAALGAALSQDRSSRGVDADPEVRLARAANPVRCAVRLLSPRVPCASRAPYLPSSLLPPPPHLSREGKGFGRSIRASCRAIQPKGF